MSRVWKAWFWIKYTLFRRCLMCEVRLYVLEGKGQMKIPVQEEFSTCDRCETWWNFHLSQVEEP